MPIRIKSDNSPMGKRMRVAASGGLGQTGTAIQGSYNYTHGQTIRFPITKTAQFAGTGANVIFTQPMFFSPLHTPINWQIASKRREIYQWARFYYENEPKVAAGIDFYADFPMNGFKLECKNKKVLKYFEKLVKDLRLNHWLKAISHEYYLLGDVYPFLEIECAKCNSTGVMPDGEPCNHPGGHIKRIVILNPDWIDVQKNVLASEPVISLVPDEELRMIVQRKQPRQIYERLPGRLVEMVAMGRPIPLSNRCASHIAHNASPYGAYGTSIIRRLFTILAYKTKLMTANWIVAERMIIPVRVVKVGDEKRPASADDIQDVSNQLSAVANDPNVTIVTHHAFDYEWYGATGKIHNITSELEQIGKEMLDGLMLNQSLLNGEMASYTSAQVGVETMIRRLESWRSRLAEWVETRIFLPTAMMQGFIDQEESKELGEVVYLTPTIKWNDMNLRDKSNWLQLMMQLQDKGIISIQKLCEEFDINYDQEVQRLREEQLMATQQGQIMGPGGMPGAGGMPMPAGGGMGGMPPGGEGAPPEGGMPGMPGMPGAGGMEGGMPGAGGMGAAPAPGMGAAASAEVPPDMRIEKRGKGKKPFPEQTEAPPPKMIRLTSLERKMYKILQNLDVPYQLFGQYQVYAPGQERPFIMDFAYPTIGVGVETDGEIWHERLDLKAKDRERDQKLANIGWRILRFREDALNAQPEEVKKAIYHNIVEAAKEQTRRTKKSASGDAVIKTASFEQLFESGEAICERQELPGNIGHIWFIGRGVPNGK